jgi:hypothetical protein
VFALQIRLGHERHGDYHCIFSFAVLDLLTLVIYLEFLIALLWCGGPLWAGDPPNGISACIPSDPPAVWCQSLKGLEFCHELFVSLRLNV